jgi:hypothetical protein
MPGFCYHRSRALCRLGREEELAMSTTRTPVRIESLPPLASEPEAMEDLRDGIVEAIAKLPKPELDAAYDALDSNARDRQEPEAAKALAPFYEAVAPEVAPRVAQMVDEALARRLPWQWPE